MIGATMLRGDLFRLACGRRLHTFRFLFAGVLCVFVAITWPVGAHADMQKAGQSMLAAFVWCEFFAAGVLIPIFVAPAIAGERERGTLELLVACPQTEVDLVVGRSLSHVAFGTSLLLAGAPFAVAAVLIGGAPVSRAAAACVHALLTGGFATLVAMLASVTAKDRLAATTAALTGQIATVAGGALLGTVALAFASGSSEGLVVLGVCFVPGVVLTWLGATRSARAVQAVGVLLLIVSWIIASGLTMFAGRGSSFLSPDYVFAITCPWAKYAEDVASARPIAPHLRLVAWSSHAVLSLLVILRLAFVSRSGRLLATPAEDSVAARPRPSAPIPARPLAIPRRPLPPRRVFEDAGPTAGEALSGAMPGIPLAIMPRSAPPAKRPELVDTAATPADWARRRTWRRALPVRGNPVFWKETAIPKNPVSGCSLAFLIGIVGISTVFSVSWDSRGPDVWNGSHGGVTIDLFLAGLFIVPLISSIFAPERTDGTFPLLLATGYEPRHILLGKVAAVGWHLRAFLVLIAIHLALMTLDTRVRGMLATLVFMSSLASVTAVAAACASATRDSRAALVLAFVCATAVWIGPTLASIVWPFRWLETFNPFAIILEVLSDHSVRSQDAARNAVAWCVLQGLLITLAFLFATPALERRMRA
ncbi:MAG: ABC transporter permease [Planctomycetes bacterium]|nr:ABC transporter permease [Planctomycetota bacterium]